MMKSRVMFIDVPSRSDGMLYRAWLGWSARDERQLVRIRRAPAYATFLALLSVPMTVAPRCFGHSRSRARGHT